MKINVVNNDRNSIAFGAKIIDRSFTKSFWKDISPVNVSNKKWGKIDKALDVIEKNLPNETIILDESGGYYTASSKNTGIEIASKSYSFSNWGSFIIHTAKKFQEQFVSFSKHMEISNK